MPIVLKSRDEIAKMREAGRVVGQVLRMLAEEVRPGLAVDKLDETVRREFARRGVLPTFLGYRGYPARVCVSVNEEIVHGIPGRRVLQDGDLVSIDLGATANGFVGDAAVTVACGRASPEAQRLIDVAREALQAGMRQARAGNHVGDIGYAVQTTAEAAGFGVVREYVGHGVGRQMHEDPAIPNYGTPGKGPLLREGMVIAIEPMLTMGDWRTRVLSDGWTVVTADSSLSAHFEHTLAILDGEPEVLTLP